MKKLLPIMITSGLIVGMITIPTEAATPKAKTYKNCTELNKAYKGGVAKASNVKNKGGKTKYKPYVSKAIYEANKKSDRDKDLIACER
jgi:Excalibur calcium-binding domain